MQGCNRVWIFFSFVLQVLELEDFRGCSLIQDGDAHYTMSSAITSAVLFQPPFYVTVLTKYIFNGQ